MKVVLVLPMATHAVETRAISAADEIVHHFGRSRHFMSHNEKNQPKGKALVHNGPTFRHAQNPIKASKRIAVTATLNGQLLEV